MVILSEINITEESINFIHKIEDNHKLGFLSIFIHRTGDSFETNDVLITHTKIFKLSSNCSTTEKIIGEKTKLKSILLANNDINSKFNETTYLKIMRMKITLF